MANQYFQFKRFTIYQDKCAMKVTTDGCLLGAIVAGQTDSNFVYNMLDIGTGTGLLTLMFAQAHLHSTIDAVEIDEPASIQAKENIEQTTWKETIQVHNIDIKEFIPEYKYDIIISNPPFYENELRSTNSQRNHAHHDAGLTMQDLFHSVARLIKNEGTFSVLVPYQRSLYCKEIAGKSDMYCTKEVLVKQTENHSFFRSVLFFSKIDSVCKTAELTIKVKGEYSDQFKTLLKDYYLHL